MNPKSKWTLCRTIAAIGLIALASAIAVAGSTNTNSAATSSSERPPPRADKASQLLGREVRGSNDREIGRIDDLVLDLDCGRVLYVVVRVGGGFLGMGERRVAVPAGAFRQQAGPWRSKVDKPQLAGAPRLTREQETQLENPSFVSNTFQYFKQTAWWGGPDVQFNNVHKLTELLGMEVKGLDNEKVGNVSDLAIDLSAGRIISAIVSQTQAVQRGSTALPPNALTPSADRQSLTTSIDAGKLASAPHFERDHWPDMTDPAWAARLYQNYGKQAYFESGELRPTGRTNTPPRIYHEPGDPKK